ncbi:Uncharacterised protein [Sphingobacterium thalpophilum]|uniref:Uncharacterized protein n=1 Tax=Sphingobacterium thalpophilum TaxID=259 RepID=A0A4U9VUF0_9SPHI|nr:Uncharacterised protein [Sphingobacterium thalpophilum]
MKRRTFLHALNPGIVRANYIMVNEMPHLLQVS